MNRWLTLALTTVLGLATLLIIDGYYRGQIRQRNSQQLTAAVDLTQKSLEEGIDLRTLVVEDLRAFILASPTMPDGETFGRYAANVLSHSPEVRALQYVDTNHTIRYIYPLAGNEAALNLDLMTRPAAPFVKKAIETRATTVNDPTVTVQGSLSIVIRTPIYDGERYLGLAQGVFDITTLLDDVAQQLTPQFDIRLEDASSTVFWQAENLVGTPLELPVRIGDNQWELTVGWVQVEPGPEPYVLGLIWGLGGALLISVLFTINQTFRRMGWLSAAVAKSTADLAESERRYRTLVETADDVIIQKDLDGRLLFRNSAYYTSLGFDEEEAGALNRLDRLHPEDESILREQRTELLTAGRASKEYRLRHKDGHWVHCFSRAKLILDEAGRPHSILTIIRDNTERKQSEEALRESEASLRESQRVAHVGHWVWDTQQNKVVWSAEMKRIFGLDPDQFVGDLDKIIEQAIHPEDRQKVIESNKTVLTEQKPAPIEYRIILPDQTVRTIWAVPGRQIVDEHQGQILKLTGIVQDITERKGAEEARARLEKQLYQAQKMEAVGQLTAGIAHDFNNLILVINGNAELMQQQLEPDEPFYGMVDTILHAGSRGANLIRQLLIFSRKQIMAPQIIHLNVIITEMNRLLARLIGENIRVELDLATDLWPVKVDPAQIEQVIVNLVVNARDAMPVGGKLKLKTANVVVNEADELELQPGQYVELTVSDTGVGMSQEVQAHLFEPFYTTKETGKGTGLGLAMVYGIVKQSGGAIGVASEVGQGTTIKIDLPRTTIASESTVSPAIKPEMSRGQETILIVEDDSAIRQLAKNVLQEQGYTVLEAEDSQQALHVATLRSEPIHLLLTDVIMPGMSGKALAEELVQRYPQMKVIFMSGYSDEVISSHGLLELGVVLLQKPFSFMKMVRKVQEVLG